MGKQLGSAFDVPEVLTPTTSPAANRRYLYFKADGNLYTKNSAGAESQVGGAVSSVAGKTGAVTLVKGDVGLANVDNTSDAAKPISTDTQAALNTKAAVAHNHSAADVTVGQLDVARLGTTPTNGEWLKAGGSSGAADWAPLAIPVQTAAPASPSVGQMFYDSDEPAPILGGFPTLTTTVEYSDTTPTAPTNAVTVFDRYRARRLPAFIGPEGQDSQLQPALFTNRIARITTVNNQATPQFDGIAVTNVAAPTAVAMATTNFFTAMVRHRYSSAATAGSGAGFRSANAQWFASSTANMGGLFMVCRFGINASTATNRYFIGFSATTAALSATVEPTTFLNCFGFACNSANTNFRFIHNDGTGTATDEGALGSNFHCQTAATNFFEFRIFVPSGAGNRVYWSAHRLNDGAFVQGGPITTDLPAINTLLSFHFHHSNGTTATAVSSDLQSLYIETDN